MAQGIGIISQRGTKHDGMVFMRPEAPMTTGNDAEEEGGEVRDMELEGGEPRRKDAPLT